MLKEKILEALTTKFEGVSSKILDRIATNLAKTIKTEEDVTTAVQGVTFQQVLESYGDSRATDATKTAVLNYEKKYGIKDGEKVTGGAPSGENIEPEPTDVPAWAKALIESNKALTGRLAAMEGAKVTETRKARLDKALEGLSDIQRKPYYRMNLSDGTDEEFDATLESIGSEVSEIVAASKAKGSVFSAPKQHGSVEHGNGQTEEATDAEVEAVLNLLP